MQSPATPRNIFGYAHVTEEELPNLIAKAGYGSPMAQHRYARALYFGEAGLVPNKPEAEDWFAKSCRGNSFISYYHKAMHAMYVTESAEITAQWFTACLNNFLFAIAQGRYIPAHYGVWVLHSEFGSLADTEVISAADAFQHLATAANVGHHPAMLAYAKELINTAAINGYFPAQRYATGLASLFDANTTTRIRAIVYQPK